MDSVVQTDVETIKTADDFERFGGWLRLPCCENSVHPVAIKHHEDGTLIISAPEEPHSDGEVARPDPKVLIALGWTDQDGSTVLHCRVLPEAHIKDSWALQVVSTSDFVQRRKFRRVATDAVAQLMDGYNDKIIPVKLTDISEGGMKCRFLDYVPQDRGMPQRFALRVDGTVLVVLAQMRWSGRVTPVEIHAGFEFLDLHESEQARIRAHVMKQLSQSMLGNAG